MESDTNRLAAATWSSSGWFFILKLLEMDTYMYVLCLKKGEREFIQVVAYTYTALAVPAKYAKLAKSERDMKFKKCCLKKYPSLS